MVVESTVKISRKLFERKTKDEIIDEAISIAGFCGEQRLRMDDLDTTIKLQRRKIKFFEQKTLDHMIEMCAESLCPETHDKWKEVLSEIRDIRKL